jgi:uncharacterized membrane-anchored protein
MKRWMICALLGAFFCSCPVFAQEETNREAQVAAVLKLVSSLKFQTGEISLHDGLAKLTLPPEFHYLAPKDAETVLVKLWGNPPGQKTLGMIVPTNCSVLSPQSWVVVIQYSEDGYVKDKDADSIDYSKLMKEMQEEARGASKERVKQGYPSIELAGWAAPPRYDKEAHKLFWAKEIRFGDSETNTLNYNIRALGRRGVLVLNVVATMDQFSEIEKRAPDIVKMAEFNEGNRYADFDGKSDKVAAYGLAALVAGGVAAKAGFFKVLWIGLLAAKKFIIIGIIALGAFIKKLFNRGNSSSS